MRPDAAAKVPGAHASQVRLSTAFENWPAGHGTHTLDPAALATYPFVLPSYTKLEGAVIVIDALPNVARYTITFTVVVVEL